MLANRIQSIASFKMVTTTCIFGFIKFQQRSREIGTLRNEINMKAVEFWHSCCRCKLKTIGWYWMLWISLFHWHPLSDPLRNWMSNDSNNSIQFSPYCLPKCANYFYSHRFHTELMITPSSWIDFGASQSWFGWEEIMWFFRFLSRKVICYYLSHKIFPLQEHILFYQTAVLNHKQLQKIILW